MSVYDEIKKERQGQDEEWGGPGHDEEHHILDWWNFIDKQERFMVFDAYHGGAEGWPDWRIHSIRQRLVKIAALAVAAIEALDRTGTPQGSQDKVS